MEPGKEAEAVLQALQQLQDAVLAASSKGGASAHNLSGRLSQLSVHLHALLQRHAVFEQSCNDRSIAEKAMRNVINSKEAEAARLRSEITRLRHHLQLAATAADTQHQLQQDAATQEAATIPDPAARQAVLAAAVAAKDKPMAIVAQLESEVSACQARINTLETELAAAATDSSNRLAEQQKAFLAKLEQLRQVHSQQLTAATTTAQAEAQQHINTCKDLEQRLQVANQQKHQQQETIATLQQQVLQLQQQLEQLQQQQQSQQSKSSSDPRHLQSGSSTPSTTAVLAAQAATGTAAATADSQQKVDVDAAALQLMEGQLARLSGFIKSHQAEIAQLRQTVMEGFTERQQLQQQLQDLRKQQQPTAAALPGALQAVKLASVVGNNGNSSPGKKAGTSNGSSGGSQVIRKADSSRQLSGRSGR